MANKMTGFGTIFIDGYELLKTIDAIASEELPVDEKWAQGLKYSKRIIRNAMGIEQEKEVDKSDR